MWLLAAVCLSIFLLGLLRHSHRLNSTLPAAGPAGRSLAVDSPAENESGRAPRIRHRSGSNPGATAQEIVAAKVKQFGRKRHGIVRAIAEHRGIKIPPEVEKFFDAIESGDWEAIHAQWRTLAVRSGQYDYSTNHWPELDPFWPAVVDAYGAAQEAHNWPAQKLLDYGNTILDSLRPGMVYVGGTDDGRWIPELLNDTGNGDNHVILTQNGLADTRYLDYLTELYGDQVHTLTAGDSQQAFQDYAADAQKRLEHDQQFPDEPKQLLPGEDVGLVDGKVQVSGQTSVMLINEKLLQTFMAMNPDLSFAMQESFPFQNLYAGAVPLGPLMELNAPDGQNNAFTAERADQSLDYWRNATQQILADPEATASPDTLKSYSHDVVAAANLLSAHDFDTEAEQAYQLATQLWPESVQSVGALADLLARTGRQNEAWQLLNNFAGQYPAQKPELGRASAQWRLISSTSAGKN